MTASAPPSRKDHLDRIAVALIVLSCAMWGLQQIAIKVTVPIVPPLAQAAIRSIGATLLLWAWARSRGIPLFGRDGTLVAGVVAGVLFAGEFLCIYQGLRYTDASRAVVFIYTAPFVVAIGLPFFVPSERSSPLQVGGLVCAFAAVAWAFQEGFLNPAKQQWIGDALALGAALLWGMTTLLVRASKLGSISAEKTLFYQLGVSALTLPFASVALGESLPAQWPAAAIGSLVFQTVVVAFASYLGWFWLLRHYPATKVSAFSFLTPMFGLAFGALLLGESVGPRLLVALATVALGIWLVNRKN